MWWAGPLSINNNRGQFQFIPTNLQTFKSASGGRSVAADPTLPDQLRDLQFTINGQFEPVLHAKPGQTEIWVLANVSDVAYARVTLTETATGKHPKIAIVGQDGNPFPAVHHPPTDDGTTLLIPPANRFAIAVTMPSKGDLVLEMPPGAGVNPVSRPGVLYTNDGTDHPPAVLGTVEVAALGDQLLRRLLRVADAGPRPREARAGDRQDHAVRRGAAARCRHRRSSTCRRPRPPSSAAWWSRAAS